MVYLHSLEVSILKTIAYFDVFQYPLTPEEIIFFLDQPATIKEVRPALKHLTETKQLRQFNNFYTSVNDDSIFLRRLEGNKLAATFIKKAKKVASFLAWLPYIKGIAISGSLSKNFADEQSDLDFFIITTANRLWIVRALYTILFKIASIIHIKDWFCLNYFIDEHALEIQERNLFTAIEIATLMPLKGRKTFEKFFRSNAWVDEYLPNYEPVFNQLHDKPYTITRKITEWLLNFKAGNILDNKLLSLFKKHFRKLLLQNIKSEKGITIGAFEATKHACKPMPQYFQPAILQKFQERYFMMREKYYKSLADGNSILQNN